MFGEVKILDMSLERCLKLAGTEDDLDGFAFSIHSSSMKAAVQLLNDKSTEVTYKFYCRNDDTVTIYMRHVDDHSPNISRAPSPSTSLAKEEGLGPQACGGYFYPLVTASPHGGGGCHEPRADQYAFRE